HKTKPASFLFTQPITEINQHPQQRKETAKEDEYASHYAFSCAINCRHALSDCAKPGSNGIKIRCLCPSPFAFDNGGKLATCMTAAYLHYNLSTGRGRP